LGPRGKAFWAQVTDVYELSDSELVVLREHCRLVDEIDALTAEIDRNGLMTVGSAGQPVAHPAIAARHVAIQLATRLLAQLKLPDAEGHTLPSPQSVQASRAAQSRWSRHTPRGPLATRSHRGSAA
jgi:hypothetical protein